MSLSKYISDLEDIISCYRERFRLQEAVVKEMITSREWEAEETKKIQCELQLFLENLNLFQSQIGLGSGATNSASGSSAGGSGQVGAGGGNGSVGGGLLMLTAGGSNGGSNGSNGGGNGSNGGGNGGGVRRRFGAGESDTDSEDEYMKLARAASDVRICARCGGMIVERVVGVDANRRLQREGRPAKRLRLEDAKRDN